jgi:hypothetical protein
MKTILIIAAALFGLSLSNIKAQSPAPEVVKQEMQKLAYMAGRWQGEALIKRGNTPPEKVLQEENIQFKLDGTALLIEGIGRSPMTGNRVVFNALAVVSYNQHTKQFGLKSYTMEGNQTEAYFTVVKDNHFEWGFETPAKAKIRYTIVLDPQQKSWIEKGDYSPDGSTWYPFIEMSLKKVD